MHSFVLFSVSLLFPGAAEAFHPCGRPQFEGQYFGASAGPVGQVYDPIAAGDLDGDGDDDVVTANGVAGTVSILVNRGGAGFERPVESPTGTSPTAVALGDIDGDGDVDIVLASYSQHSISVMRNHGDGSFAPAPSDPTGTNPLRMEIGDLDGDGDLDVVTTHAAADSVCVLLNGGDGSFAPPLQFRTTDSPSAVAIDDLDGDADPDLAVVSRNGVAVHLNDGAADFTRFNLHPLSLTALTAILVTSGDFDRDGDNDIAIAWSQRLAWMQNDGQGGFALQPPYVVDTTSPLYASTIALSSLDVDGDGDEDVVSMSSNEITNQAIGGRISVVLNEGRTHVFVQSLIAALGAFTPVDDVNGDGRVDLAFGAGGVVVLVFNRGGGKFSAQEDYSAGTFRPRSIATADLDHDGDVDVAVAGQNRGASVLWNDGNGAFPIAAEYLTGAGTWHLALGDIDRDEDVDLVVVDRSTSTLILFENSGHGRFLSPAMLPTAPGPSFVAIADLDGDGDDDLAVTSSASTLAVHRNAGDGTFGPSEPAGDSGGTESLAIADLDGDGDLDVAASRTDEVIVLVNDGDGTFAPEVTITLLNARFVTSGDLDRDGDVDLVVTKFWNDTISVLMNDGGAQFGAPTTYAAKKWPTWTALGDLDSDGDLDMATGYPELTASNYSIWIEVRLNAGDGSFAPPIVLSSSLNPSAVAIADVDGDGKSDIVAASFSQHLISVHANGMICADGKRADAPLAK